MKPIIGVTCNYVYSYMPKLSKGGETEKEELNKLLDTYVGKSLYKFNEISFNMSFQTDIKCVEMAGGIPFIIPNIQDENLYDEILDFIDGIIFTGGNDLSPNFYNEEEKHNEGLMGSLNNLDNKNASLFSKEVPERDIQEITLMKKALLNKKIPILGICRGAQILNVSLGGTLYQDTKKELEHLNLLNHSEIENWNTYSHEIKIKNDSILYGIFNKNTMKVNSIHHQSIKKLGKNLSVSAFSTDEIIESIEYMDDERFVLGVQWHPEMLILNDISQLELYKEFIKSSNSYKKPK